MLETIAFARRQSPDWAALAADYRANRPIDPARYVPDHAIPGFPDRIDLVIAAWNDYFSIDFFTCREFIAALSRANLAAVSHSTHFTHDQPELIRDLAARTRFLLFFHDDDDFFASEILSRLSAVPVADVAVFPLLRVHIDLLTFVRGTHPSAFIWGRREDFAYRFQSNNYAINSNICTPAVLRAMKDHVQASEYADAVGLNETMFSFPVSATVKSPCSASVVAGLRDGPELARRDMAVFAERFTRPELPPAFDWLARPLSQIASLFAAIARDES